VLLYSRPADMADRRQRAKDLIWSSVWLLVDRPQSWGGWKAATAAVAGNLQRSRQSTEEAREIGGAALRGLISVLRILSIPTTRDAGRLDDDAQAYLATELGSTAPRRRDRLAVRAAPFLLK